MSKEVRALRRASVMIWAATALGVVSGCGNKPGAPDMLAVGTDGGDVGNGAADAGDGDAASLTVVAGSSRIFVPAYIYPGPAWDRIIAAAPTVGIMVANPADGPGPVADPAYVDAISRAKQAGIMVLGYVATTYGQRASSDVLVDINAYYDLYRPQGIFLSEGPTDTDCAAMEATFLPYANAARARDPQAFVAVGTRFCPSYIYFTDLMVLFSSQLVMYGAFQAAEWMPAQSSDRFAHFVSEVPNEALEATLGRARALGAGWIYVTDDALPNPWDQLPSYFEREVQIVATLR